MNALTFLNSPLLWGLALASVPIVIHLLYRRRFRRVDWAPMRYLKLSVHRNRRRIQLEQWLLLLLRVAAVLLLFLAVARPVLHAAGLGGWLSGGARSSQLLLIDTSLSMGHRERGKTALERARELAIDLVKSAGQKDTVTLATTTGIAMPLLREVEAARHEEFARVLNELTPSDTFTSWPATLAAVDKLLESSTFPLREVIIVTDLRRARWEETLEPLARRWAADRVKLRIFDVGSSLSDNLAVLELEQVDRTPLVGAAAHWEAVVHNGAGRSIEGWEATFTVDGQSSAVSLPTIGPQATARVPLAATFQTAGLHQVALRLSDDDLPADNLRQAVVEVREHLDVLLVDGEPSSDPLAGEVDFLAVALSIGVSEAETWRVEIRSDLQWAAAPLSQPDLLVLANVASISPSRVKELAEQVERGMGLMLFVGDQIDMDRYNQTLFRDGAGLLPARLDSLVEEEIGGLLLEEVAASPLSALSQLKPAVLEQIRIRKFARVDLRDLSVDAGEAPARVLARWNDAGSSPAVLDKTLGRGRVLFWTLTADKAWSDWPIEPSYVLAMREAAAAVARASGAGHNLTAGEPLARPLPAEASVEEATIEMPGIEQPRPLSLLASNVPPALVAENTSRAGMYKLSWQQPPQGAQHDLFAVNPDRRESLLERIPAADLQAIWSPLRPEVISAVSSGDAPLAIRGREIWRTLAAVLLGLLLVEACFATWVGRPR